MLPLLSSPEAGGRFAGVCYFDEGEDQWMVCDKRGRRLPRHVSPIREAQALTLFDEARCRGADLQLRIDATAVLTLVPATHKDKLMQAAGRLRKLGACSLRSLSGGGACSSLEACRRPAHS